MIENFHTSLDGVKSYAAYSDCKKYRYALTRQWDQPTLPLVFLMLNPSTATEEVNDPTVQRCETRARKGGYGGLTVLNLFAYRATDPDDMKAVDDPIGPENDNMIADCIFGSRASFAPHTVVCGWGVHGSYRDRDKAVLSVLNKIGIVPFALGFTKDGQPRHPLYMPYNAKLVRFP